MIRIYTNWTSLQFKNHGETNLLQPVTTHMTLPSTWCIHQRRRREYAHTSTNAYTQTTGQSRTTAEMHNFVTTWQRLQKRRRERIAWQNGRAKAQDDQESPHSSRN